MRSYPILILHGWNLNGKKYSPLIKALKAKNFTVYAPDLPGFGKNAKLLKKPLTLEDYVDYVVNFLRDNHIIKPIIIGHSFGGRIAIKLAFQYPNKIKALILSGTPAILLEPRAKIYLLMVIAKLGGGIFSLPGLNLFKNFVRKLFYKIIGSWDYYRTQGRMRETFKNIIREDLETYLPKLEVPSLVIWGEKDSQVPVSIGKKIAKRISKADWLILKGGQHGIPYEKPAEFAEAVVAFATKIDNTY